MKKFLILASIAALIALGIYLSQSIQNGAIVREEQVNAAQSDMTNQYRRRADLLGNLADAVKSYNQHEAEIFRDMAKGSPKERTVT